MKTSNFLTVSQQDWLKAFWIFLISTAISVVGDAAMQLFNSGTYSLESIHWREICAAIGVAVISYVKKNLFTNSNDEFLKKDAN